MYFYLTFAFTGLHFQDEFHHIGHLSFQVEFHNIGHMSYQKIVFRPTNHNLEF